MSRRGFFDHRGGRRAFMHSAHHHVKRGIELSGKRTPTHAGGSRVGTGARRLWQPIFLRPRRVFRNRRLRDRDLANVYGFNAWAAFAAGIAAGAGVGAAIGALTFPSGLRGSYFALVTMAFAEVLRIVASVTPITGAGVGILIKLDPGARALQFQSRAAFYWFILALVAAALTALRA